MQVKPISPYPLALVEQRIKSNVIKAERSPSSYRKGDRPKEEPPATIAPQTPHVEAIPKEASRERAPKEVPND